MPNCRILLSLFSPKERTARANEGLPMVYLPEQPQGVYHGLEVGTEYWIHVIEDAEELKRELEQGRAAAEALRARAEAGYDDEDRKKESCSCLDGAPCVDPYGCKDWNRRFAVAKANGWKGF